MPQPPVYPAGPPPAWGVPPQATRPPRRRSWLVVLLLVAVVACIGLVVVSQLPRASGNGVVYESSLRLGTSGWVTNGNCFFQADGYHIKGSYICYAPVSAQQNASASVSVKQTDGDDTFLFYGIVLRRVSQGNYYMFAVDSQGKWRFGRVVDGKYVDIVKERASDAINTDAGATNVLAVRARAGHFTFLVNGTQVGQADDATFTSGLWGLSGGDGIEVAYTDLKITRLV
jgi:hypothetical protein